MMLMYSGNDGFKTKRVAPKPETSVCQVKKSVHKYANEIFKVEF